MSSFIRPDRHRIPPFTRSTHLGASKLDLERDSGFSDASSEYLSTVDLTDTEDATRNGLIVGQDATAPPLAVMGGSYAGLSPMIIMNNFVVKQPSPMVPADKQWSFSSPMEVMPQSQVVLLQPMMSNGNSSSLKTGSENVRQSKSNSAFKSYPRIAPHPADATKRPGSSRARVSSASRHDQRERRHHRGHRLYSHAGLQPAPQSPARAMPSFDVETIQAQAADGVKSLSPLAGPSTLLPCSEDLRTEMDCDRYQDPLSDDSNKRKRFSNTYNILNKSGLLGITMRTKQLIKENKRTQGQLQQLQEQTALLLEALSSGDPQLWTKLQLSVQHTDKEQWGAKVQRVVE